jgi:DNA-binding NarL/FixJ family response regulator
LADTTTSRIRVLLVEDSEPLRRMLSILLANDGGFLVVGEADDGAAAVAMAAAADPDLVLLDLEMPVMDGLTALPQLRKVAPRARIVVLSAYPDPFTLVDALRAGADLCLDKAAPLIDIVSELAVLFELPVSGSRALSEMAGES